MSLLACLMFGSENSPIAATFSSCGLKVAHFLLPAVEMAVVRHDGWCVFWDLQEGTGNRGGGAQGAQKCTSTLSCVSR